MAKYQFASPYDLQKFTDVLNSIFHENNNEIDLSHFPETFRKATRSSMASWFENRNSIKLKALFKAMFPSQIEISTVKGTKDKKSKVLVAKRLQQLCHESSAGNDIQLPENCSNNVIETTDETSCSNKDNFPALTPPEVNYAKTRHVSKDIASMTHQPISQPNIQPGAVKKLSSDPVLEVTTPKTTIPHLLPFVDSNQHLFFALQTLQSDYRNIHISYVKVRLLAMILTLRTSELDVHNMIRFFNEIFKENFFTATKIQNFITLNGELKEKEKANFDMIKLFINHFFGDIIQIGAQDKIIINGDITYLYIQSIDKLHSSIQQINRPECSVPAIPESMNLIGNDENVNILAQKSYNFHFPDINTSTIRKRHGQLPTLSELNDRVNLIRKRIAQSGNAVNSVKVLKQLCEFYQISTINKFRYQDTSQTAPIVKAIWNGRDIPALNDLERLQCKVNAYVQAFVTFRNICTLHELQEELCIMESKPSFEDFKLGPLQKQEIVYKHFYFPPEQKDIPTITTEHLLKLLWKFNNKKRKESKSADTKVNLEDFFEYLMEEYSFSSPYESGVKIRSVALAMQVMLKASFKRNDCEREAKAAFNGFIVKELRKHAEEVGRLIANQFSINNITTQMINQDISTFFNNVITMLKDGEKEVSKKAGSPVHLLKHSQEIHNFFKSIKNNETFSKMFHIVLSVAQLSMLDINDLDILTFLGFNDIIEEKISTMIEEKMILAKQSEKSKYVNRDLLYTALKKLIKKNEELDAYGLYKMEQQIVMELQPNANSFHELGHQSLLQFLSNSAELMSLLQKKFKKTPDLKTSFPIPVSEVSSFVNQFLRGKKTEHSNKNHDIVIGALHHQFWFSQDCKKNLKSLLEDIDFSKHTDESPTIYETALSFKADNQAEKSSEKLLDFAIKVIQDCPYMVCVEEWIGWANIFQKKLGLFKTFVKDKKLSNGYYFVEIDHLSHIKVRANCSIDDLVDSLEILDHTEVSNVILSLIITSGHVDNAPLSLINSHVESCFKTHKEKSQEPFDVENSYDEVFYFTLKCFSIIPFNTLSSIVSKIFLAPLSMVFGSTNISKLLLRHCRSRKEKLLLHALGLQLADSLWIADIDQFVQIITQEDHQEDEIQYPRDKFLKEKSIEDDNIIVSEQPAEEYSEEKDSESDILKSDEASSSVQECTTSINQEQENGENKDSKVNTDAKNNLCFELIENIRKEQFGIGVQFDEEQQKLIEVHREREGRSLQRLSKELYSTDSHFALELIQNADDNEYDFSSLNEGEEPSVAFILHADKIVVLNNEKGFMTNHIRALCDVGKSTKGIHRKGYIGQKGIGFKSVFRITDCPEIHSNGYHIKFDATEGPNGYILPTWIEQGQTYNFQCEGLQFDTTYEWKTNIVLPLKREMKMSNLVVRFDEVHKSLLMFLNRLKRIIIANQVSGKMTIMKKVVIDENLIELFENEYSQLWFVVSKEISMKLNNETKTTDISIAFPLGEKCVEAQLLFAFLPLRSYGFKFIIQADFEIPSSREDIYKDSAWNQCILQNLPSLMILAFHKFKDHKHFTKIDGILEFFKFMDIEEHVLGIFQPVADQILKALKNEGCMPCEAIEDECDFSLSKPTSVIFAKPKLKDLIPPTMLNEYLNLYYIHKLCESRIPTSNLKSLGVRSITINELLEVATKLLHKEEVSQNYSWLSKWFILVYDVMQETCGFDEKSLDKIRNFPVFPLSNGTFTNLCDVVFLPVSYMEKNQDLKIIEKDLNIIHRQLIENMGEEKKHMIEFFKWLGLKMMEPYVLIHQHIIPILKDGKWKSKSEELLIACVKYLFKQYVDGEELVSMDTLKSCMVVKTNHGMMEIINNNIYIPHCYGNDIDLAKLFPSADWLLVHDVYVKGESQYMKSKWLEFFKSMGFHTSITFEKVMLELDIGNLMNSVWKEDWKGWPETVDGFYIVHDVVCKEFVDIINGRNKNEIIKLAYLMNAHWRELTKNYDLKGCVVTDRNGNKITNTYSSLYAMMVSTAWLPSENMDGLFKPSQLFIRSKDIESLFGGNVPYVSSQLSDREFVELLECQTNLTIDLFCEELLKWTERETFTSTYDHILNIYKYIFSLSFDDFQAFMKPFANKPIIFAPLEHLSVFRDHNIREKEIKGKFYEVNKVCWVDPLSIFAQLNNQFAKREILRPFYGKHSGDFEQKFGVLYYPPCEEYIEILNGIARNTSLPDKNQCSKIFLIMSVIGETLIDEESIDIFEYPELFHEQIEVYESLKASFREDASLNVMSDIVQDSEFLPCSNETFTSLSSKAILCFNKELSRPFSKNKQLQMVFAEDIYDHLQISMKRKGKERYLVEKRLIFVLALLKACDLPVLSNIYNEPVFVPQSSTPTCVKWESVLHRFTPIIQRCIFSLFPSLYTNILAQPKNGKPFKDYLYDMKFFVAKQIEVVHRLEDRPNATVKELRKSGIESADCNTYFYVNESDVDADIEVVLEELLCIFVGNDVNHKNKIHDFLIDYESYNSKKDKENFLQRKKIQIITSEEEKWEFPEPFVEKPKEKVAEEIIADEKPPITSDGDQILRSWPLMRPDKPLDGKPNERNFKLTDKWKPPEFTKENTDESKDENKTHSYTVHVPRSSHSTTQTMNQPTSNNQSSNQPTAKISTPGHAPVSLNRPIDTSSQKHVGETTCLKQANAQLKPVTDTHTSSSNKKTAPSSSNSGSIESVHVPQNVPQNVVNASQHPVSTNIHPPETSAHVVSTPTKSKDHSNAVSKSPYNSPKKPENTSKLFAVDSLSPVSLELQYEDVPLDNTPQLKLLFPSDIPSSTSLGDYNKIGEQIVYEYLLSKHSDEIHEKLVHVQWLNEGEETGQPYDIKIVTPNGEVTFIEVKTTISDVKQEFPISSQQIKFAFEKDENLHLYRVSGLSSLDNVKVKRLVNLSSYLDNKAVRLFMVL